MHTRTARTLTVLFLSLLFAACASDSDQPPAPDQTIGDTAISDQVAVPDLSEDASSDEGQPDASGFVYNSDTRTGPQPYTPQVDGDPEQGYWNLVNGIYVSCGPPRALANLLGAFDNGETIPGREPKNDGLPYYMTAHTAENGAELMVNNCLTCHAGRFNGELIVGLGDHQFDYSIDAAAMLTLAQQMKNNLQLNEAEIVELEDWIRRMLALAPYSQTPTMGLNPAESVTAGILEHLDPLTLIWQDEVVLEVPEAYKSNVAGLSVPPWWWAKKKNIPFYTAVAGGSHLPWAMLASSFCVEGEDEVKEIEKLFPDIMAYINSIEPPEYPWTIDAELAVEGKEIFEATCSQCHGTYGDDWTYPSLVLELDVIGTDPELAIMMFNAKVFHEWFESSYYGKDSDSTPSLGYSAPPLDAVWATAPYLHNSSVPTIAALLESSTRPTCWKRSYDSTDYNTTLLGYNYEESDCHMDVTDSDERKYIFDATLYSYSNDGHYFGDVLSPEERTAVLEYIKTL
jgi:mono/diheme cytochrome c family protein